MGNFYPHPSPPAFCSELGHDSRDTYAFSNHSSLLLVVKAALNALKILDEGGLIMAIRHGTHHGISFILGIILSVLIGDLIRNWLPSIYQFLDNLAALIKSVFRLPVSVEVVTFLIVAFVFVVIYGMIFGILERKRSANY